MLLLLLTLLLVPALAHAQASPYTCAYSSPPLEQSAPLLLGWPDIRHKDLPPEVRRELRVYQSVAIAAPDYSLRIVDQGQVVTGELLVTWPGVDFTIVTGSDPGCRARHEQEAQQLKESVLRGLGTYLRCAPVETRPRVEGCRVLFTADPGWADMLRRADSIGIWTLSTPPRKEPALDGVDVAVELRDHAGYRTFSYNSPAASARTGMREVAAMSDLLDSAYAAAHAQLGR